MNTLTEQNINFEELNPTNKQLLGVNKVDYRLHNWL